MIVYTYEEIKVKKATFKAFHCDKCKKEIMETMELQETYRIQFTGGYGSVFGDGASIECDLCQRCLKDMIGDICRCVNTGDDDDGGD